MKGISSLKSAHADLKNFVSFFWQKKKIGLILALFVFGLLLLPGMSYYQTLQNNWSAPQVATPSVALPSLPLFPINKNGTPAPSVSARGILIFDSDSSVRLLEKDINSRFPPASTTKMMTALVVLDSFKLDDVLSVPYLAKEVQDKEVKLQMGEKMTVESLFYAMLVASSNSAAETFAANYPGGREAFIEKMNEKAKTLSLKNTHFANPTGLDQEDHYSSPLDLVMIAKTGLINPEFAKVVRTQKADLSSIDGKINHFIFNVNQLLGKIPGVFGIKTGFTDNAGECLISYVERDGRKIIIVLLGSEDRFGESEKLINWVFDNFQWIQPNLGKTSDSFLM
ncbi:MAG: D-alanyl-D-alanine carboxypeptidase family protein [bacterium]|nr:D-alanyl-D-alanine carboxypeptidase family protein [bacterium]